MNSAISVLTYFETRCICCLNIPLTEAKRQHFKIQEENQQAHLAPKQTWMGFVLISVSQYATQERSNVICYASRYGLRRCKSHVFCYTCMGPSTFRKPSNYCQMDKRLIPIYLSIHLSIYTYLSQSVCDIYLKTNLLSVKEKHGNDIYFWWRCRD